MFRLFQYGIELGALSLRYSSVPNNEICLSSVAFYLLTNQIGSYKKAISIVNMRVGY